MERKQREVCIESYGTAFEQLLAALQAFPREMWQFRPEPGKWTIHEMIIHLADAEANSYGRLRRGIAEPGSAVFAYNQDTWASALRYHDQDCDEALQLFRLLRQSSYKLIKSLPEAAWANTIEHPDNGTMTLDDWLAYYSGHTPDHIRQMQECHRAWQAQRG